MFSGVVGLIVTAFHVFTPEQPAVSLLLLILGLACAFPSMLTDGDDQVSAMRAAVLLVVSAFVLVAVRQAFKSKDAKIDYSWVTVALAALGAKAAQSVPEAMSSKRTSGPPEFKAQ
jgi:lysylphosphatidylglycerol synthetase-like protein (DUF2156 family)